VAVVSSQRLKQAETALWAAGDVLTLGELAGEPLRALERALGATGALLYRYSAEGALERLGGGLCSVVQDYGREIWVRDPAQQRPHALPPGPRVVLPVKVAGREAFRGSDAYGTFYRPREIEDLMCVWLSPCRHGAEGMTAMLFVRPRRLDPFDRADVALMRRLLPAFASAVRRQARVPAVMRRQDQTSQLADWVGHGACVAVDREGRLLWVSKPAERFLLRSAGFVRLPEPVARACRVQSERKRVHSTVGFIDSAGRSAQADLIRCNDERAGTVIVSFHADARETARRHGLTSAEWRVLGVLAQGLSNPEIACRLHVSLETVRTHVKRVLAKLGLHSRLQAALWKNSLDQDG
jgi:DNA-binding CsgD family transcriptional regulator